MNDKGDCRQYDSDYVGLINISPTTGTVYLAFTQDLSLQKKPNLIRTKGNNAAYNAVMQKTKVLNLIILKFGTIQSQNKPTKEE